MSINERLKQIITIKEKTQSTFALKANYSKQRVNQLVKEGESLGLEVVKKIIDLYPDVNIVWFITGDGEMMIKTVNEEKKESITSCQNCDILRNYIKVLEAKLAEYESNEGRAQRNTA